MANTNFVSSAMIDVLFKLQDIFPQKGGVIAPIGRTTKAEALKTIYSRQTLRRIPQYENGKCVGYKVMFLRDCSAIDETCVDFTAGANSGCAIPAGEEISSAVVSIGDDCPLRVVRTLDDDLCNNEYEATELILPTFRGALDKLASAANRKVYADLLAKAQANAYPDHVANSWVNGLRTDVPAANWTADFMLQLGQAAEYNGLMNFLILDGGNLNLQRRLSDYHRFNDDERHTGLIFDDYPIAFDNMRDIQEKTGRMSTFLVDTSGVGIFTRHYNTNTDPNSAFTNPATNLRQYHVPLFGGMDIMVDVNHTYVCTGRGKGGNLKWKHTWEFILNMQTVFAPNGCNNETGVLEFVKVP